MQIAALTLRPETGRWDARLVYDKRVISWWWHYRFILACTHFTPGYIRPYSRSTPTRDEVKTSPIDGKKKTEGDEEPDNLVEVLVALF